MTLYSLVFLTFFLPFFALIYYKVPKRCKPYVLSSASLIFYISSAGKYFYILLLVSLFVYLLSRQKRVPSFLPIMLLPLFRLLGIDAFGVSFFVLRAAAYLKEEKREKNFVKMFSFLMLFPTVGAGPVTRYSDVGGTFDREIDYSLISRGILRLLCGSVKKLFFADTLFEAFDGFMYGSGTLSAILALVSFSLYIYFDFSGYSDTAIGICNIFGIALPKNFDFPYISRSVGEFFRRWHISLGRFLFDYVYIPLGGSKKGRARTVLSLFAVWLFSSLWHGSSITYLIWGGWFFALSVLEKFGVKFKRFLTLILVLLGWVPFFSESLRDMTAFLKRLFALGETPLYTPAEIYMASRYLIFLVVSGLLTTPLVYRTACFVYKKVSVAVYIMAFFAAWLVLSSIASGGHRPFLYASF